MQYIAESKEVNLLWLRSVKEAGDCLGDLFLRHSGRRYFFANPQLRAKYAHKEAHKAQAVGGGVKVAYRKLPRKKHPGKHVAR